MKILFDQNISQRIIPKISHFFPEAKQVKELNLEGCTDKQIWNFAKINGYTIVTFDSDFFEFSVLFGHPPKVIWVRIGNNTTNHLADYLLSKKELIEEFINNESDKDVSCIELIG